MCYTRHSSFFAAGRKLADWQVLESFKVFRSCLRVASISSEGTSYSL
jgi:hypothetical protein